MGLGQTIDLSGSLVQRIEGIETLDVVGTGADTIVLGALAALRLSDLPNAGFTGADSHRNLVVLGDAEDTLSLLGLEGTGGKAAFEWALAASDRHLDGSDGGGYDFYNLQRSGIVVASVAVDSDMTLLV
jgi:hypothetical protein